jgi:hypothetical protein
LLLLETELAGKYNPFRPDKIVPPGLFCGRIEEINFLDHCLLQAKQGNAQHFLIEGERGIGKSSLMMLENLVACGEITARSEKRLDFIVAGISLQDEDDYFSLIRKISDSLSREIAKREKLKGFALAAWDLISRVEGAGFKLREAKGNDQTELMTKLQADLVKIAKSIEGVADGIFLMVDEADRAPSEANLGLICKLLTEELSRNQSDKLCIGLAGLPGTLDRLRDSHESSPRLFKTLVLQPLEQAECQRVLRIALEESNLKNGFETSITPEARDLLVELSEGYPHFLQEFSYCAFESDSDNVIDVADVKESLYSENGAFDQLGRKYFDKFYTAPDSDDYRTVLDKMADHSDSWVSRSELIKETALKGGTVDNALRALKMKNIIVQNEMKSGLYKLPTKSFGVWIKARKRKLPSVGGLLDLVGGIGS